ncbi:MAG: pyridoxal-dependent decarboxylase [Acidobacteriota bacterium]|nr:pyridoxal-dependent decarboxylase [Acidobacteriota bacterium]
MDVLRRALHHAEQYLEGLDRAPVAPTADLATMRRQLLKPLGDGPLPPDQVIDELVADCQGGIMGSAGGRFFAWVIGGAVPAALAADWLTSTWDQNAGIYAAGPAAAVVEEVVGAWLKDLLGLPAAASFALVTGCQMAHVTCLAAARDAAGAGVRIICGETTHGTVDRAIRLLGMGGSRIVPGLLNPGNLAAELEREPDRPAIVVLQAGELNTGAYDSFEELIPIARAHKAWVHVDGAFGLWAAVSRKHRHLLKGVEQADSWATDGHKWLNVPYDCGYAFVKDSNAHRAAMSRHESYLIHDDDARDQVDWNPEFSRRARGFPTYAALRQLGRSGLEELVERCCELARQLVLGIGALPGAEVLCEPTLNQGLLRFGNDDEFTDQVIGRVVQSGEAFFGGVNWRGRRAMRVSVCNWRTTAADVERVTAAFAAILQ